MTRKKPRKVVPLPGETMEQARARRKKENNAAYYQRNKEKLKKYERDRRARMTPEERAEQRAKQAAWARANPDKVAENAAKKAEKQKEASRQRKLALYGPEEDRKKRMEEVYRQRRKEKRDNASPEKKKAMAERIRQWQRDNPEKVRAAVRRWQQRNPEKVREYNRHQNHRRRAEEQNKALGMLFPGIWLDQLWGKNGEGEDKAG